MCFEAGKFGKGEWAAGCTRGAFVVEPFWKRVLTGGTFFVVDGMACQPALTGPAPPDCHWLMLAGILTFPRDFFFFLLMKKQANLHAR